MIRGTFSGITANTCRNSELPLDQFYQLFILNPAVRETKDGPLFTCTNFEHNKRGKDNVIECYAAVLDFDEGDADPEELCQELDGIEWDILI